ncbi:hypothetical protein [Dehalobacter sp. MCB1]|uniref:hypothetical protein n=1 Tax=Dehalobacter sp. MCB1 TaxID=1844756 RepID=UPI00104F6603|nr:hypothetical protein [Dehalobacter sp. MCB1]
MPTRPAHGSAKSDSILSAMPVRTEYCFDMDVCVVGGMEARLPDGACGEPMHSAGSGLYQFHSVIELFNLCQ